ncbi:MAG: GHMP kinase [Chlamydiae bacterium]|nr:MAG: GHMP kinase [Chlamydiota bacterium]
MQNTVINAVAPTRICDVGGWTDTHFAKFGAVFNIAVYPYVEIQINSLPIAETESRVVINAENFGDSYSVNPGNIIYDKHPLIEAAIKTMKLPDDIALKINIFSYAPPGASMGTSAAVSVALTGALDALTSGRLTPHEVASLAHSLETKELGLECGVQDQLASVHGGINFIEIDKFPHTNITKLKIPNNIWWELEQRLLLTYIGKPHQSSEIHKMVIADLGNEPHKDSRLEQLRRLAHQSKNALCEGDFAQLGGIFNENIKVQEALHKNLICDSFKEIISIANNFDAIGCKVNGAGGDGGSVAILTNGDMSKKRELKKALIQHNFQILPIYLSRRGLRIWKTVSNKIV